MNNIRKKAICVKNVTMQYEKNIYGIRDISVDFFKGELIALIDSNGAGKSTFINVLCGLLLPTNGQVFYDKKIINDKMPFYEIGWSKQTHAIDWYLNVYDNVYFGARISGIKRKEAEERTLQALKLVGLLELKNREVDALSGGQQQRVQIARALVHDANVLILDEPTTGLDAQTSEDLLIHLRKRADAGALVIVSSHDLHLVEAYCDKVLLLKDGKIVAYETKQTFLAQYMNKEVLTITYDGELPQSVINQLKELVFNIDGVIPLRMEIPRDLQIGQIVRIVDPYVRIIDINRSSPGLREAYLEVSRAAKGGASIE